jgi:hypothetical protein
MFCGLLDHVALLSVAANYWAGSPVFSPVMFWTKFDVDCCRIVFGATLSDLTGGKRVGSDDTGEGGTDSS